MGEFSDKVFDVVRAIPRGKVCTYGGVARAIGHPRSARYVGYALRSGPGPEKLPCHRVVFSDGRICESYAFGGPDVQRSLLQEEGVPFLDEEHIDLSRCAWEPGTDAIDRPTDIDWHAEMAED